MLPSIVWLRNTGRMWKRPCRRCPTRKRSASRLRPSTATRNNRAAPASLPRCICASTRSRPARATSSKARSLAAPLAVPSSRRSKKGSGLCWKMASLPAILLSTSRLLSLTARNIRSIPRTSPSRPPAARSSSLPSKPPIRYCLSRSTSWKSSCRTNSWVTS